MDLIPTPPTIPKTTSSSSPLYRERLSTINSRASLSDPLNTLIQREKLSHSHSHSPSPSVLKSEIYSSTLHRMNTKCTHGSFVVEADDFAAVACWEPPLSNSNSSPQTLDLTERPLYAKFITAIEAAKMDCLKGNPCWQLSLMARDPERTSKGAVRVLVEGLMARARREKVPVWCVAGNERARDVYAYFGMRVVVVVVTEEGKGEDGVRSWCMVGNWPVE